METMKLTEEKVSKKKYIELFERLEQNLNGEKSSLLHQLRKNYVDKFNLSDFPTNKHEEWKYTNIKPIINSNFKFAGKISASELDINKIEKFKISEDIDNLIVFIDGIYSEKLSSIKDTDGLEIIKLKDAINSNNELILKYFNKILTTENAFTNLNNAFLFDGVVISIKDNSEIEKPIHLLYINGSEAEIFFTLRNLIIVGNNSKAKIIESYQTLNNNSYFINAVSEINLNENSNLERIKIINESNKAFHISRTEILQKRNSVLTDYSLSLDAAIIRNDLVSTLQDEGIECNLYGLYIPDGEELFDNHTAIDHRSPHCNSNQLYKGILNEKSKGVFNGKVFVRRDAQKTNAYQSNKNLLLSTEAQINTKPQLEIFADDVKCSHGATVGQIDKEALFYLQSRGISKDNANMLLMKSFVNDVTEKISDEKIRDYVENLLVEKMKNYKL